MRLPTGLCLCSRAHSFSPPPRVCPAVVVSALSVYTAGAESSDWAVGDGNESPFGEFDWPRFSWTPDSWKSFLCHVSLNKTLVEATEGMLGPDILSNSSPNACCGYKSVSLGWEALSTALAPEPSCGRVCFSTKSAFLPHHSLPCVITVVSARAQIIYAILLWHVVKYL